MANILLYYKTLVRTDTLKLGGAALIRSFRVSVKTCAPCFSPPEANVLTERNVSRYDISHVSLQTATGVDADDKERSSVRSNSPA